jgi:post-segregation antitoxin (ccd killing protein)
MAKTSLYLPDDLAEQVRAHDISISEVAQAALRQAVKAAEIKENVMTDLQADAERLQATRAEAIEADVAKAAKARAYGAKWARTAASFAEFEYVVTYSDAPEDFSTPASLVAFISGENEREHRAAGGTGLPGPSDVPTRPDGRYWPDLRAGARDVWNAVFPLLMELDKRGASQAPGSGGYSETVNPEYRLWLEREPRPDAPQEEHDRWASQEPEAFL